MEKHAITGDIRTEQDIHRLVDAFYRKVLADPVIGYIFTDIAVLSWEKHIPVMYSFWASLLLGDKSYNGNPIEKHIALDKQVSFNQDHFDRWLFLWKETVNENFNGDKAGEAVLRAQGIAGIMFYKIQQSR